jgi:hypothetical protein
VRQAQRECPAEPLFNSFAEQIRRGQFDDGMAAAAAEVRERLAASDMARASEVLEQARGKYGTDPRWKALEQEVAKCVAYESGLKQAEQHRSRGDLDKAEARLTSLIREGTPDDRATRLMGALRDQRFSERLNEADSAVGRGDFDTGLMLMKTLRAAAPPGWTAKIDAAYQQAEARKQEDLDRERQQREAEISSAAAAIRERLERDEIPQAAAQLAAAKTRFPNEGVWFALQREIETRKKLLESQARAERERLAIEARRGGRGAREAAAHRAGTHRP